MGIQVGKGTVVRRGNASNADPAALPVFGSDTFTVVPKVQNVELPEYERSTEVYPILDAGSDVKLAGANEPGDYVVALMYDKAVTVHASIYSEARGATPLYRNWEIVTPDNETHRFVAPVTNWSSDTLDPEAPRQPSFTLAPFATPTVT